MLAAERSAVKWEAYHSSLNILEREMTMILTYLGNIGTQAALIMGFVFSCLVEGFPAGQLKEGTYPLVELLYMGLCTLCIGLMTYTVICATLTTSLGPAMALKGKEGPVMRTALEHMKQDRRLILGAFGVGTCAFAAVVICMLWIKLEHFYNAIICTLIFGGCSVWCLKSARRTIQQYDTGPESGGASGIPGAGVVTGAEYLQKARGVEAERVIGMAHAQRVKSGRIACDGKKRRASWRRSASSASSIEGRSPVVAERRRPESSGQVAGVDVSTHT